jgi:hypothetical protein
MTRKEFIKILKDNEFPYKIVGDNIVISGGHRYIDLDDLTSIPPNIIFSAPQVWLKSLKKIPNSVVFNNVDRIDLESIFGDIGWFHEWEGHIKGIGDNQLLNAMIKNGIFDRQV